MRMKSLYLGCNTTFTLKLRRIAIKGSFFASLHALTSVGLRNDTIIMTTDDVNKMRRMKTALVSSQYAPYMMDASIINAQWAHGFHVIMKSFRSKLQRR